jgi:hypothetical protein
MQWVSESMELAQGCREAFDRKGLWHHVLEALELSVYIWFN